MSAARRPLSLTIAALGGQGGGVVSNWLIDVARREGFLVQATSVPGVAQRTGATIYYLEFFPESAVPTDGRPPVMALMPNPGDVDVVVASELAEAGRAMQRGLVTPDRTTLITSTHRVYTISEKSNLADGRVDADVILAEARREARRLVAFDMAGLAERTAAIISPVVLGAIAGAAGLPFAVESYRHAIRASGLAIDANLAAFEAGLERASGADTDTTAVAVSPAPGGDVPNALRSRIATDFPIQAQRTLALGVARLVDYQDQDYAVEYLDRIATFVAAESAAAFGARLTDAVARGLALWMSFEDTIRVAELKTRPARFEAIRREVRARPDQVIQVREFLKPRVDEICGTLPAGIGARLFGSPSARHWLGHLVAGREVCTTAIGGYLLLRGVAALKRWRRGTLRFAHEWVEIERWLAAIREFAARDYGIAVELAECQRLVRGYGETHTRGLLCFQQILTAARAITGRDGGAEIIARLRHAALADDRGDAMARELSILGLA